MNQPLWTAADIERALHIRSPTDFTVHGVSIDTRTLQPGDLFIGIQGDAFDGNDFVETALANGAAAVLTTNKPVSHDKRPVLEVADTTKALKQLGTFARARAQAKVIALTGSVGKTTTKEMLAHALGAQGKTHATVGNLNNHWGLPLTLARLPQNAAYAILELGMNHAGEITLLSKLAQPHIALITTIDAVHLGNFNHMDEIAAAKAEIFDGLSPDGIAILPHDNNYFEYLKKVATHRGIKHVYSFGTAAAASARLVNYIVQADYSEVAAEILGEIINYRLNLPGLHNIKNSLAVLLAAKLAGADVKPAAAALTTMPPITGRGTRQTITTPQGAITVIDESYNASVASITAALEVLGNLQPACRGRRIAVLGDILELGTHSHGQHQQLLPALLTHHIDVIFACGPAMQAIYDQLPAAKRGAYADNSRALAAFLTPVVRDGDIILVKGSNGMKMSHIITALITPSLSLDIPYAI